MKRMKVDNTHSRSRYYIHEEWTDDAVSKKRRWSSVINLEQTGSKRERLRKVWKENSE